MNEKKIFYFAIGPISASLLGLVTLPIVAWLFSAEDIGRLTMLNVVVSFTLLLFSLGLDQAYVREFHEVNDKSSLLKSVFLPGFFILILVSVCLSLSPYSLSILLFGIDSEFITFLVFAAIFLSFVTRFLSLILRMQERGLAYSLSQLFPKLLFLLVIISYLWFGAEAVFDNLAIANFLSLLAVFAICAWNTRKEWIPALTSRIDKAKQLMMIRYSIPLIGSGVAFWGLTSMDKLFLRSLSSFDELGIYSVSVSFAGVALMFQAVFSTVWAPIVYKWATEGINPLRIKTVIDYVTLAVVIIWSLAGMFSWSVAYILPPEYDRVQYILLAAMAYPLLYTLSESTGVGIGIKRKTMFSFVAAIVALVINAVANWFLIPIYGAAGASMASAIAFLIFFVIRTEASSKLWVSFERRRMYGFMVTLLALSFVFNTVQTNFFLLFGIYFTIFLLSLLLFRYQTKKLTDYALVKFKFKKLLGKT